MYSSKSLFTHTTTGLLKTVFSAGPKWSKMILSCPWVPGSLKQYLYSCDVSTQKKQARNPSWVPTRNVRNTALNCPLSILQTYNYHNPFFNYSQRLPIAGGRGVRVCRCITLPSHENRLSPICHLFFLSFFLSRVKRLHGPYSM